MFQRPLRPSPDGRQPTNDRQDDRRGDDLGDDGAPTFAWEFEVDTRRGGGGAPARESPPPSYATRNTRSQQTVDAVRVGRESARVDQALARSLERWWAVGELPSAELLLAGLLHLEAGGDLPDAARALLLRAALAHGRGWQTALRHRGDDELSAVVVAEALVIGPPSPVEDAFLLLVVEQRASLAVWLHQLQFALRRLAAESMGEHRRRAGAILAAFEAQMARREAAQVDSVADGKRLLPGRRLVLLALLVGLIGFLIWERVPRTPQGMAQVPAGTYALPTGAVDGPEYRQVTLAGYWLDLTEVTNRDYRRCVAQGACRILVSDSGATRPASYLDPALDEFPVVNVPHAAAREYCLWQGGRLPTIDEWQVGAAADPVTGRATVYPWGQEYAVSAANSVELGVGDILPVGSFRPAGDSPTGVSDMAGNVAEWTAELDERGEAVVKGGAYLDDRARLRNWDEVRTAADTATAWLGFRCARSLALGR